jgi:hypothetical protein
MSCIGTPRRNVFHARSAVRIGRRKRWPKAMHARSPSESPLDRVLPRNLAISSAISSSNGHSNNALPRTPCLTSLRRTSSGFWPRSASFVSTSAQFTTFITATLPRASSAVSAPDSSLNQAKSAEASRTEEGVLTYVLLSGLPDGVPELALPKECVLARLKQTSLSPRRVFGADLIDA